MKKFSLLAVMMVIAAFSFGQEQGLFRGNAGGGVAIPSGGAGVMFNMEGNYNILDNMNVGIRYGTAFMVKNITSDEFEEDIEADMGGNSSILATTDYFFTTSSSFTPFVGGGLGYYMLSNISVSDFDSDEDVSVDGKFGFMLRGGFEVGKFRLSMEYDIVPKTEVDDDFADYEIKNSYFGITAGMFFGGGRW